MPKDHVIEKEMGIGHDEFFRNIGRALPGINFQKTQTGVVIDGDDKRLDITIAPEGERRIALMRVPVTRVTLTFRGYGEDDVSGFMATFDRAFQRGGG